MGFRDSRVVRFAPTTSFPNPSSHLRFVTSFGEGIVKGHTFPVSSVAFSSDGKRVVTGSYDNTARVWDALVGLEILNIKGHTNYVNSVCFSPDGKRIVT